jgi:RNA polymerase sigma factor (sigma-70 family)
MISDQELLQRFREPAQRDQAFALILRQNQKQIYYYVRKMVLDHDDADDLTQTTFIKAWKGLDGFRGESKLSTWLYKIAYHECLAYFNEKKRMFKVPIDNMHHHLGRSLQEDTLYTGDEIQRRLQLAVASLPEKQKAVFIMKYFEEKKYEEIAEITGTSVGALKASFHHAVTKIEAHVSQNPE